MGDVKKPFLGWHMDLCTFSNSFSQYRLKFGAFAGASSGSLRKLYSSGNASLLFQAAVYILACAGFIGMENVGLPSVQALHVVYACGLCRLWMPFVGSCQLPLQAHVNCLYRLMPTALAGPCQLPVQAHVKCLCRLMSTALASS